MNKILKISKLCEIMQIYAMHNSEVANGGPSFAIICDSGLEVKRIIRICIVRFVLIVMLGFVFWDLGIIYFGNFVELVKFIFIYERKVFWIVLLVLGDSRTVIGGLEFEQVRDMVGIITFNK